MERIQAIDRINPSPVILKQAAALIIGGKVVVCPTDTGYAFSANALDVKAITRVFELKGRAYSNPVHVAVSSIEEAEKYAKVNEAARHLALRYLPGALTMVLLKKDIVPPLLVGGLNTVGIRIPDNNIILELARMTGLPITTTSANISGKPTPYSAEEVIAQLGETIKNVTLILDEGTIPERDLSTIVDLSASPLRLIRQGKIDWTEISAYLESLNIKRAQ